MYKPQVAKTILTKEGIAEAPESKLVISILAGITISQLLKEWVPSSTRVIRTIHA